MENRKRSFQYSGRGGSGAFAWIMQRLSGLALIVLTLGHFFMVHSSAAAGHTWKSVSERLTHPALIG